MRTSMLKVACLSFLLVTVVSSSSAAAEADHLSSPAAALQPFVDRHVLAGAVTLVATRDKIVHLDAVGYADLASHKPMSTDALFWIASQSKPMTATALMMLVD